MRVSKGNGRRRKKRFIKKNRHKSDTGCLHICSKPLTNKLNTRGDTMTE